MMAWRLARNLVKLDKTGNVTTWVANIVDMAVTLQSSTHLGKISLVAWVAGITEQRSSASDTFKLPEENKDLLIRSSDDLWNGEIKEFRQFFHELKDAFTVWGQ